VSLSTSLTPDEIEQGWLYPDINRIRDVSVIVARGVIRMAQEQGLDREIILRDLSDAELDRYIQSRMYDPKAEKSLVEQEVGGFVTKQANGVSHL
jgi:malate dehydrogenase (oxaloacetate-decarboxylating)(NADP+)